MSRPTPTEPQRRLRAVLLDVDGTLIDTNLAHARAWVEALREVGIGASVARLIRLIGMGGDKILPRVSGIAADSPIGERIAARRRAIFLGQYLPSCRAFPGARELLERLRDNGLRRIVASSAQPDELTPLLERAGIADLIEASATSGDAEESKPDPDIVQAALDRAGTSAHESIMLGDTPYDVEAARRAGVPIIALRCGGWDDSALTGAAAVYDDPAALLIAYHRSPLMVGARLDP
jgi:phosphoglycolate phosphatase-like HAD superfamily hydrolase